MPLNFALTGVAGYIAPRHLRAIRDTGHRLVAAADPHDSVGLLDQFGFDVRYFSEIERFDRHLEKLRRGSAEQRVHYLSVCSPTYLHDAHCRLGLRVGADVICEKPLVINPWNLDPLQALEHETGRRIYTVLQLRHHPRLLALQQRLAAERDGPPHEACLTYITPRGAWYYNSWKGTPEKSGGLIVNVGIHLLDLLGWLFGPSVGYRLHHHDGRRAAGFLEFERARVRWFLSLEAADLPPGASAAHRSLTLDGEPVEFSDGFTDLHTQVYAALLAGRGLGLADARPAISLAHALRHAALAPLDTLAHPALSGAAVP
jgi:UDP-N-acetyl-2-amino-2-deoxyglucuronate dehydrogenase